MIRILYVDDEADIREIAQMSLELDPELEVRTCGSGAEAIEQAESWQPQLILLDVMMPVMDGPTVFAHLRRRPATADIQSDSERISIRELRRGTKSFICCTHQSQGEVNHYWWCEKVRG